MKRVLGISWFPNFRTAQRTAGPFGRALHERVRHRRRLPYWLLVASASALLFASILLMPSTWFAGLASFRFYPNCSLARSFGAAPIKREEPDYRPALDADDDGVACEPLPR